MPQLALHSTSSNSSLSSLTTSGSFSSPSSPTFTQGEPLHRCLTRDSSSPSLTSGASPLASTSGILYTDKHVTLTVLTLHIRGRSSLFGKETTIPLDEISSAVSCSSAEPRWRLCGLWRRSGRSGKKHGIVMEVKRWMGKIEFKVEDEEAWWAAWELARSLRAPKE